jgi:hypothetical protein
MSLTNLASNDGSNPTPSRLTSADTQPFLSVIQMGHGRAFDRVTAQVIAFSDKRRLWRANSRART